MTLKDWLKIYKEVEERYLVNAESDGQSGDMDSFEYLTEIATKLKEIREKVEVDYNLHQFVNTLQFANLLVTLDVYNEVIPYVKSFIRDKEEELKKIEGERAQLQELVSIRTSVLNAEGKFQEVLRG